MPPDHPVGRTRRRIARWRPYLLPVAVLALGGTALFGLLHALLIVPIWARLPSGIPRALFLAVGMTWCYRELRSRARLRPGAVGGLTFGLCVWAGLIPVSLVAAALRVTGLRSRLGSLEPPIDLSIVALTGAAAGYALTRSLRGAGAAAVCMVGALGVLTNPLAFSANDLERTLFLGLLPIYAAAGVALSALLVDRSSPPGGLDANPPVVRAERPADREVVREINELAFGGPAGVGGCLVRAGLEARSQSGIEVRRER